MLMATSPISAFLYERDRKPGVDPVHVTPSYTTLVPLICSNLFRFHFVVVEKSIV
jgi:hypothetical protein